MSQAIERLQQLESIEKDIGDALLAASKAVEELSRDKQTPKQIHELHTHNFLKKLEQVESGLSLNISYLTQVSTSQPHEGSSYASQKDLQMAFHRLEHVRSRLAEMDRWRHEAVRYPTPGGAGMPGWQDGNVASAQMQPTLQRTLSQEMPPRGYNMVEQMPNMSGYQGIPHVPNMQRGFPNPYMDGN